MTPQGRPTMTNDATISRGLPAALAPASMAIAVLLAQPAFAAINADPFAGMAPVGHSELGELRGGMMIDGLPVNFAVVVSTTVQSAIQPPIGLQTVLTIGANGGVASSTSSSTGNSIGTIATNSNGLSLSMNNGSTEILQNIMHDQVQTLISNAANGMSISHSTAINVTIPGYINANNLYSSHQQAARIGVDSALSGIGR